MDLDARSQDSTSTSDENFVVLSGSAEANSPQVRITGVASPVTLQKELQGILAEEELLSGRDLSTQSPPTHHSDESSSSTSGPPGIAQSRSYNATSSAGGTGSMYVRDVLYLGATPVTDVADSGQLLACMRQKKEERDVALARSAGSVVSAGGTLVVVAVPSACFGELRIFPTSNEKVLLRSFPLMNICLCVRESSHPEMGSMFAFSFSETSSAFIQPAVTEDSLPKEEDATEIRATAHVFMCKTPVECEAILHQLRQTCNNGSQKNDTVEHLSNTLVGLRLELDILEEDSRGQFYAVPRDRADDLFKFRTNVNKRIQLSVTQIAGSVPLTFQRCVGLIVGSGRYLKDEDFMNLELDPNGSKCEPKRLMAVTTIRFPLEGELRDLTMLNTVTEKDRFIFFTVGLHLMAHPVETPITLKLHLKARVFTEAERFFWLYNKKPVVEDCRIWLKEVMPTEESREVALSVLGVDYMSRTECSTSHMTTSTSSDFFTAGGVGLFQHSAMAGSEPGSLVEEDDDEPLLSGTGTVSKEVTDAQAMEQWSQVLATWHAHLDQGMPPSVKPLVRRGIPEALRGEVWLLLAGVHQDKEKSLLEAYKILISKDSPFDDTIQRDMSRTFPGNALFQEHGELRQQLFRVSKAYSVYDEQIGYVQGTSFLVAAFLLHMPEEQAFMVLVQVMNAFGLRHIISRDFAGLHLCLYQLDRLIMENMHDLWKHFNELEITPMMYASQWFITLFSSKFPLHAVFNILDLFLCEGMEAVFKVALGLLKLSRKDLLSQDFDGVLKYFRVSLPKRYQSERACKELLNTAVRTKVNVKRMQKYAQDWQDLRRAKSNGEENPLESMENELRDVRRLAMRLEWENDLLATEAIQTQNTLQSQLTQVTKDRDNLSEKYSAVSQELYNTRQELVDTQEQRDDLLKEVEKVKQLLRSQVQELEQRHAVKEGIIQEYKEITGRQGDRLDVLDTQLKEAHTRMAACTACFEWLQDKATLGDTKGGGSTVSKEDGDEETRVLRLRVQELEMELASLKLALTENQCSFQEQSHEMKCLHQHLQRLTAELQQQQSGRWWSRFKDNVTTVTSSVTAVNAGSSSVGGTPTPPSYRWQVAESQSNRQQTLSPSPSQTSGRHLSTA